jgi:hypothetical protein
MKADHGKNTLQQRRRCLHIREKRALEPKKAQKHPVCHRKIEGGVAKKLANPCGRKIITKTAKNSSFTP